MCRHAQLCLRRHTSFGFSAVTVRSALGLRRAENENYKSRRGLRDGLLHEGIWTSLRGTLWDFRDFYGSFGENVPVIGQGGMYGLWIIWATPPSTCNLTLQFRISFGEIL